MPPLQPDYLTDLASQIGSVSAFLGGFAATMLALFLTVGKDNRGALIAAQASAIAALCFIITVVASTAIMATNHPKSPMPGGTGNSEIRVIFGVSFLIGVLSLLAGIGASGWSHSKQVGVTTTILSMVAVVAFLLIVA